MLLWVKELEAESSENLVVWMQDAGVKLITHLHFPQQLSDFAFQFNTQKTRPVICLLIECSLAVLRVHILKSLGMQQWTWRQIPPLKHSSHGREATGHKEKTASNRLAVWTCSHLLTSHALKP